MKYVKMVGLAAVAAMAFMAYVGASSASAADRLCETNTNPCTSPVAIGGVIKAEATTPVLTGSMEIHCNSSTATVKVTSNSGISNPTGEVTGLSWNTCRDITHNIPCTVTTQGLNYHAELVTPGPNITVKAHAGGASPGARLVCGIFLSCTFQRADFTLPVDVGSPASATANEVELEKVGGLCPEEAFWDAKYIAESPTSSLFVSSS